MPNDLAARLLDVAARATHDRIRNDGNWVALTPGQRAAWSGLLSAVVDAIVDDLTTRPATPAGPDTTPTFDEWAIVELLGHRRLAGHLREVQVAGAGMLRLDIPAAGDDPARTQFIAPGSVYALHPVDEDTARAAAQTWRPQPVQRWELPGLPRAAADLGGDFDDEDDDRA
jgi:hypothetical protein